MYRRAKKRRKMRKKLHSLVASQWLALPIQCHRARFGSDPHSAVATTCFLMKKRNPFDAAASE